MTDSSSDTRAALRQQLLLRKLKKSAAQTPAAAGGMAATSSDSSAPLPLASSLPGTDRTLPLPLSWAQQRLWFIDQLVDPASRSAATAYHLPLALKLTGRFDVAALQASLDALVARHESLRTRFVSREGEPRQQICSAETLACRLQSQDLRPRMAGCGAQQREQQLQEVLRQHVEQPFDLACGPLLRAWLLRCSDEDSVLLLVMHHIISDGWSLAVLTRELVALYAALSQSQSVDGVLPALPLQYADHARAQREPGHQKILEQQQAWWCDTLQGAPALLELPVRAARPAEQSHRGASLRLQLTPQLSAALREFARRQEVTLHMLLSAAWALLLARLSGEHDIVIGVPVANRLRPELEGLIGFFVNTLALRLPVDEALSVTAFLSQVKTRTLAAYAHQELPFEQVVEALRPQRSLAYNPVFQVMLTLQNAPQGAIELPGLRLAAQDIPHASVQCDLSLVLHDDGELLRGELLYASDLFEAATLARWLECYKNLLAGMLSQPQQPLAELALLSAAEARQMLAWAQPAARDFPQTQTLAARFEAQVARNPAAIALCHGGQTLSYGALDARANRLAHWLQAQGAGPEERVLLCLERGFDMLVAILAVLKTGAAYVPVDPQYPAERLGFLLQDAAPRLVIATRALADTLALTAATPLGSRVRLLCLDELPAELAGLPQDHPPPLPAGACKPEHLAYIIYTSGSTGQPKGVMVEQRQVGRLLDATAHWFGFGAADVWTLFHSYAFDFSVWEIFAALLTGGRLVIPDQLTTRAPEDFYRLLVNEGVTVLNQTPSAFMSLIAAQERLLHDAPDLGAHALRCVIFGGEALEPVRLQPWVARNNLARTRLINMYGITETTVHVSYHELAPTDIEPGQGSPIGVAIPDLELFVLDERLRPQPVGVAGELYVGGAGLARGYFRREELTRERFIAHPFDSAPGARLYRTGDVARWRADGRLDYLGRNDLQLKLRGFRIEPGEISAQLLALPAVREAVVLARPVAAAPAASSAAAELVLVAYVVLQPGQTLDAAALRQALQQQLPDYMLPASFVSLDSLPLTAHGKLDTRALPAPDVSARVVQAQYAAPQGRLEEAIVAVWQEVLGLARIGRHDNFFDLGGHSLLIVQVLERLRAHGLRSDVRTLFQWPTPATLAQQLAHDRTVPDQDAAILQDDRSIQPAAGAWSAGQPITPADVPLVRLAQPEIDAIVAAVPGGLANVEDIYALTPLQAGMLFHHRLDPARDAYVLPMLLRIEGRDRLQAFCAALQTVVARHSVLRSCFQWQGLHEPVQVVLRELDLACTPLSLSPDQDVAAQLTTLMQLPAEPLHLDRAPLLRLQWARDPQTPVGGDEEERAATHYVLLQFHHIISDHYALELVMQEVAAVLTGRQQQLPAPVPYRHFVAHVLARAASCSASDQDYFRRRLADIDAPCLPFGLADTRSDGCSVDALQQPLAVELEQRLRRLARTQRVSVATLMHAAMALMVARGCGQQRALFGTVLSGRLQAGQAGSAAAAIDTSRMPGLFINTLPLRVDLTGQLGPWLQQLQADLLELVEHEQASLVVAQRCSGLAETANTPLFSALLNFRHAAAASAAPALDGVAVMRTQERTNYPLIVNVDDLGQGLQLEAQLAANAQGVTAARILEHLQAALSSLLAALEQHADIQLARLDGLPQAERQRVLCEFNAERRPYASGLTLVELLEQQVARTPAACALRFEDERLSYAELNARANQLAHWLMAQGIGPGMRVAVSMERSFELLVSLLAVLKVGAAYVPIDPDYPEARIAYMLDDAAAGVLLTQAALNNRLAQSSAGQPMQVLAVDAALAQLAALPHDNPAVATLDAAQPAYVIYTSGSTGAPKGAPNSHAAVVNRLLWMQEHYQLGSEDRVLQKTPFGFDVSVWEFFWPLITGAELVLARPQGHQEPAYLRQLIIDAGITTVHFVPSMLQVFLEQPQLAACTRLRRVLCSGEALPPALASRCLERLPQAQLDNLYGPTEAAIDVSWWPCRAETLAQLPTSAASVPIGHPINNLRLYVLDPQLQPCPLGVAGEVYIAGAGVGLGYHRRPALTAERFLPDLFGAEPGARMYRTGDLGRWNARGELEYLGRNDQQVKLRGQRIELGEIEARLLEQPGVREAVVLVREDRPGDQRLVAYVTLAASAVADEATWRAALHASLPAYMLPNAFVVLEAMPLSPNGKLERRALPAPEFEASTDAAMTPPQGALELQIAALWQELLGLPSAAIDRHADFFALGGHSLTAMQLVARLGQQLGRDIPLRLIFEAPSIAALADALAQQPGAALSPIPPAPLADHHPLSHAQRRLWFLSQIGNAAAAYHIPAALRFGGHFDVAAMQAALDALVARHAPLRSTLIAVDGEPMQWPGEPYPVALPVIDMTEAALPAAISAFALEPFNLETGPLLRACVFRLAAHEHVLAVCVHHIVADGWSLDIALREVAQHYAGQREAEPTIQSVVSRHAPSSTPRPPGGEGPGERGLSASYIDYAHWQRHLIASGGLDQQRAYWLQKLAGELPILQLPSDFERPLIQSFAGGHHLEHLPAELQQQVQHYCQRQGVTPYMLLLAIYQILLMRLTGQTDILIGSPIAGRQHPQVAGLIGFFVNTLVLRADLSGAPSFQDYLQRVRQDSLDALAHQDYPFDLLVDELDSRRDLARQAVFDTSFTVETQTQRELPTLEGLTVTPVAFELPRAKFDLSATVAISDGAMCLQLEYSSDLFAATTIARYAGYYLKLLRAALAQPDTAIDRLPLISASERAQLLGPDFAGTPRNFAVNETLPARIGRIAAAQPQAIAARLDGISLSYGELEARANQLAHYLLTQGVTHEDAVVLCLERSFDMLVAILGVLKAGGCYVPIEPGLPAERLRFLIADSGARHLITHGKSTERLASLMQDAAMSATLICLEAQRSRLEAQPATPPELRITPEQRAYIIYTSGSTGTPKGCQLTHANVLRLFAACEEHFDFRRDDVWSCFHSYAFDFSVWEIFGALLYGGRVVMVPALVARSPADFAELLAAEGVTQLSQTPSAFLRLLEGVAVAAAEHAALLPSAQPPTVPLPTTEAGERGLRALAPWAQQLRYVVFGGEALDYMSLKPWFRHELNPATRLINMYGITETTVHVTWREISAVDLAAGHSRSHVGRPLADLTAYILDAHGEPQPVGVAGELYVAGAGLARGYLNRPALTAERFITHLHSQEPGARLYRSGDLARWSASGDIEYLGRIDHQVKIHGYRIELGEIEARLMQHPALTACVVLAVKDTRTLQDRLMAWFVATAPLSASTLRSHLAQTLPDYMIPHGFTQLPAMPLTANGKLDRQQLSAQAEVRPQLDVPYVMPESAQEVALARIWSEVLGVARIGLQDNFFDLGGDSFSAYRLMTHISDELGHELPLEAIFKHQTIAAMVTALNDEQATQESSLVQIQAGEPGVTPFFCAHQAGGDVLSFRALAQALGAERPFYGVQSAGRLLGESQHQTLEAMCADYLRDIRALQPQGPYYIGGHSMGGKVAYELARQLEDAGEEVAVLAIFDSDIVNKNTSMLDSMLLLSETFRLGLKREEFVRLEPKDMMDHLLTAGKKRFARVLEIAYDMDLLPRGFRTRDAEMFLNRIATNIHVSDAYIAPPIHSPVSLFLASDHTENSYIIDVDAWRELARGGVTVYDMPGNHLNLIQQPHVAAMAEVLQGLFAAAEARVESRLSGQQQPAQAGA